MAQEANKSTIPEEQAIIDASNLTVLDSKGKQVRFGDIYKSEKTIFVFIRHFFCGMCQGYVTQLASVSKEALEQAGTKIVVVGCGDWEPIDNYRTNTGFSGSIYADPSRAVYRKLGMTIESLAQTPAGEQKRSYVNGSFSNFWTSIWKGPIKNPLHMGKQGNLSQLGGDLILGPGNKCSFAHLMQHTQDHVEVVELMQAAQVKLP